MTIVEILQESPTYINVVERGPRGFSYTKGDPLYVKVRNQTGVAIAKGVVVYTSGANGTHVQITPAIATSDLTSARTVGFTSEAIAHGADGYVMIFGYLEGIDTEGFTAGQIVYLSTTQAGKFTATKPQAPGHMVYLGVVARANKTQGKISVHVQNGYELDELHNVKITNPQDGQVLKYQASTHLWINSN